MANPSVIAQLGASVLREQAKPVADITAPDIQETIAAMQATLAGTQGVGLAAPQISVSLRIIIVASRPTPRYPHAPMMEPTVMINPSYRPCSQAQEKGWEGCLSIPSIRALVPRYQVIAVSYTSQQGEAITTKLDGFVARVFQHEFDHLDGIVYLDRVDDNRDIFSETEYFRQQL